MLYEALTQDSHGNKRRLTVEADTFEGARTMAADKALEDSTAPVATVLQLSELDGTVRRIRATFEDAGDASAFASYTSNAYPGVTVYRVKEREVAVDLPKHHYSELPHQLYEVARRFSATETEWTPEEVKPVSYV